MNHQMHKKAQQSDHTESDWAASKRTTNDITLSMFIGPDSRYVKMKMIPLGSLWTTQSDSMFATPYILYLQFLLKIV